MDRKICPICGEGTLTLKQGTNEAEYKGVRGSVSFFYEECDACGSEQADASLTLRNKRLMLAFRKQVDGLLTGDEVRAIRNRLKLKQSEAARVFGGGPTAFSKYESDDVAQSAAMDKLLRLADAQPAAFRYLCRLADVETPEGVPKLEVIENDPNIVWHTLKQPKELDINDSYQLLSASVLPETGSYS